MEETAWNFEQEPSDQPMDETSVNLRHYFDLMPDEKLRQYSPSWNDQRVIEWDGNFCDDGHLLLPCTERDVEIQEYRDVIAECIRYRDRVRSGSSA